MFVEACCGKGGGGGGSVEVLGFSSRVSSLSFQIADCWL